jgi:hypothetical protein
MGASNHSHQGPASETAKAADKEDMHGKKDTEMQVMLPKQD